jgi:hypothetical protein
MISRHVDIWAILLLLFAFALFTRTSDTALRVARSGIDIRQRIRSVEIRVSPFELNRLWKKHRPHHIAPLRFI